MKESDNMNPESKTCKCQWMDISTAPKDGTMIVLTNGRVEKCGRWQGYELNNKKSLPELPADWRLGDTAFTFKWIGEEPPTHWRYIIELPKATTRRKTINA